MNTTIKIFTKQNTVLVFDSQEVFLFHYKKDLDSDDYLFKIIFKNKTDIHMVEPLEFCEKLETELRNRMDKKIITTREIEKLIVYRNRKPWWKFW